MWGYSRLHLLVPLAVSGMRTVETGVMITPNRCSLCPGVNACIPVDGQGDLLFIGEAPGFQEDRHAKKHPPGRPFIGRTGEEVDSHYLPLAGLRRRDVRFTNAIRCLPVSAGGKLDPNRTKDLALLESCTTQFLYPEIERHQPRLLIPLGSFACRAVCPELDLDLHHGIPIETPWGIPAFPMYHPALGMHEPKRMLQIRNDWQRLKQYLKGTLDIPVDEYAGQEDYQEVTDVSELDSLDPTLPLAGDTESTRDREPYCFTFSQSPGAGRLVRANRRDLLLHLRGCLQEWRAPILFHNWLYDWPITQALGLALPTRQIVDTMARSFHLGNLPQGYKALAFRELGMVMQDFQDLVIPYSRENVLLFYRITASMTWPKPEEELVIDDKTGLWKLYKPQGMNTKFKRFFTDLSKAPDTKDVFQMWEKNWVNQQSMIEEQCGPYPGMCISHVPFDKVLHYACRDVDGLIRLWPVLKRMASNVRKTSQERWREHDSAR